MGQTRLQDTTVDALTAGLLVLSFGWNPCRMGPTSTSVTRLVLCVGTECYSAIFCHGDALGLEFSWWLAFMCSSRAPLFLDCSGLRSCSVSMQTMAMVDTRLAELMSGGGPRFLFLVPLFAGLHVGGEGISTQMRKAFSSSS